MNRVLRVSMLAALVACTVGVQTAGGALIPAFARRYRVSCNLCHTLIPKLSQFGENFAGNGFRMASQEQPQDTIETGDALLTLYRSLPAAIRVDAYINTYTNGGVETDFQAPYNVKLLSGGPLSDNLSYYLYFLLFERGEIGGVEDAFVTLNDVGNLPLDATAGQFQVSDPIFKRELRLEYQDYAIYRAQIGEQPANLTYDRGVMLSADLAGFTITGEVLNGKGIGEPEPNLHFDNDPVKNVFGHVSRDVIPNLRLGAMGYYGRQKAALDGGEMIRNRLWMLGADATITAGPFELNAQYIHREDDTPTFTPGEAKAVTNGGFAELIVHAPGSRWYGLALYNLIDADRPLLNVGLGGPSNVEQYEAVTAGLGYLVRRNFRLMLEGTWDIEQDEARWTVGLTTGF